MKRWSVFFVIFMVFSTSNAQTQRELYHASVQAYEVKDYKTFLKLITTLDSLRPLHPTYTYNLASAHGICQNQKPGSQPV